MIQGPNVMRGYLNRAEATAETLVDGWLHTGDVGDPRRGRLPLLVDRIKDMIIRGGENIYPKEIETVLYQHPAGARGRGRRRAHDVYGEVPVAFVAVYPGATSPRTDPRSHPRVS